MNKRFELYKKEVHLLCNPHPFNVVTESLCKSIHVCTNVNAIITSRLDYCNALLYGTSAINIARLQRIHDAAARLIMRSPRSVSSTPLLRELHWLPIVCGVDFKLLVFTYTAMHNDAPLYWCELVCPYQPTRTLRSVNKNMLEVKRTRTKAGDCSFAVAAASLWNNLPIKPCDNLTSFKLLLKTHSFHIAY